MVLSGMQFREQQGTIEGMRRDLRARDEELDRQHRQMRSHASDAEKHRSEAESRARELRATSTSSDAEVKRLRAEIAALQSNLAAAEVDRVKSPVSLLGRLAEWPSPNNPVCRCRAIFFLFYRMWHRRQSCN
jgi:chromosome segregation ATPase